MKIFLSLVAFFSIPLVSMQAALANVSEKNVVSKSVTSTSKALSHVDINPFVDIQRLDKAKLDEKSSQKKHSIR